MENAYISMSKNAHRKSPPDSLDEEPEEKESLKISRVLGEACYLPYAVLACSLLVVETLTGNTSSMTY